MNGIHTARGGTHVDSVLDPLLKRLVEYIKRRIGSADSGTMVREKQIKNHMMVFVNCLIESPSFDSQVFNVFFQNLAALKFPLFVLFMSYFILQLPIHLRQSKEFLTTNIVW